MNIRKLTDLGRQRFREWLEIRKPGEMPPTELLTDEALTTPAVPVEVDLKKVFDTRLEFGKYMVDLLHAQDAKVLLKEANDGMWDWIRRLFRAVRAENQQALALHRHPTRTFRVVGVPALGTHGFRNVLEAW